MMAIIDFIRRLGTEFPVNIPAPTVNIPPPVIPKIPTPVSMESPVLQSYIKHIQNFPAYEPPGKLRRIAGLLTGIGEAIKSGPSQGYAATRSVIDEPYNRNIEEWTKRAAELKNAATVEGQSYINLAKLMQGERKLDLEEQKIADARDRARQNLEVAKTRAQAIGVDIIPAEDGLYAINKITGDTRKLPVDIYTKPEEFRDKLNQALSVAGMYTGAYRDRTAALERMAQLRTGIDALEANVSLERYLDELATRDLAASNPDLVGTVIGFVNGRLQLVPQEAPAWYNVFGENAAEAYKTARDKLEEIKSQYKLRYGNLAGIGAPQQIPQQIPQSIPKQQQIPQQIPKPIPKQQQIPKQQIPRTSASGKLLVQESTPKQQYILKQKQVPQQPITKKPKLGGYDFTKPPSLNAVRKMYPKENVERIDFHPLEGWIALGKNGWFRIE